MRILAPRANLSTAPEPSEHHRVRILDFSGDDAALLEALWRHDPSAKHALYTRFAPVVQRVALSVLGIDPEVADVIGDTFVEIFAHVHKVRHPAALADWVRKVTVHVVRRRIRRRRRRIVVPTDPTTIETTHGREAMDMEARETLRTVYHIMDTLPPDERIVFALRTIEGCSFAEIQSYCGWSRATVHRKLVRAQQRFAQKALGIPALERWIQGNTRWHT